MARKYDEIMSHLAVTNAMRSRILAQLESAGQTAPPSRSVLILRRTLATAACLAVVLAGISVLPRITSPQPVETPPGPVTVIPNLQEASSAQALSSLVGFPVSDLEALPFLAEQSTYTAYGDTLAQIRCEGDSQWALFRKSAGTEDNSGDYTAYTSQISYGLDDLTVNLKGNAEQSYVLAVWTDGDFAYSLRLSQPLTAEQWIQVISANR
ncbi:MAG: hypothetical protein MSB10_09320 [Clostridiales bacterium]|uniref:hypothetical protein n=1 Tax=Flavonifractor porci TaxID=3133422 RepID=UPI0030AE5B7D|nr:hypothetical protein [Clostridiales bacterium]